MRPTLAKAPPHHTAPAPQALPEECPRCGAGLDCELREVNLTLTLDDGAEIQVLGHECACCGWCCAPEL